MDLVCFRSKVKFTRYVSPIQPGDVKALRDMTSMSLFVWDLWGDDYWSRLLIFDSSKVSVFSSPYSSCVWRLFSSSGLLFPCIFFVTCQTIIECCIEAFNPGLEYYRNIYLIFMALVYQVATISSKLIYIINYAYYSFFGL